MRLEWLREAWPWAFGRGAKRSPSTRTRSKRSWWWTRGRRPSSAARPAASSTSSPSPAPTTRAGRPTTSAVGRDLHRTLVGRRRRPDALILRGV